MEIDPRFGIAASQFHSNNEDELSSLGDYAIKVEELGFQSIWVQDTLFANPLILEPLTTLSYIAAKTRTIKLGTAVLLLPIRSPSLLAKIATSIDFLSGGRLILGIALGGKDEEYYASGITRSERVPRLVEALRIIRLLWSEEQVNFDGRYWTLTEVKMRPKPKQSGGIPIWLGGGTPGQRVMDSTVRRAAKLADGWLGAGSTTLEDFKDSVQRFLRFANQSGRDANKLSIAKRVYIHVDSDYSKARRVLSETLSTIYGSEFDIDKFCVFGDETKCAVELGRFFDAGARTLILNPVTDYSKQAEILARDVVSKLA